MSNETEYEEAKIYKLPPGMSGEKQWPSWELYAPHTMFSRTLSGEVVEKWIEDLKKNGFQYQGIDVLRDGREIDTWVREVPRLDAEVARVAAKYLQYRSLKATQESPLEEKTLRESGEQRESYLRFVNSENRDKINAFDRAANLLRREAEAGEVRQEEVFSFHWPWLKKETKWVAIWFSGSKEFRNLVQAGPGDARLFDTRKEAEEFLEKLVEEFHDDNSTKRLLITNVSRREIEIRE